MNPTPQPKPKRKFHLHLLFLLSLAAPAPSQTQTTNHVILAIGEPGQADYQQAFTEATTHWTNTCTRANANLTLIGTTTNQPTTDRAQLQQAIKNATTIDTNHPLWIILHGHGTFDGREAKFNLRGPDISAPELATWLTPLAERHHPTILINTSAASAPFLAICSATNRIVITATKSAFEDSYAYFGSEFAKAIGSLGDTKADLDHDGAVSLLEAFLVASREVDAFYRAEQRIRTEEALLDDNGDKRGTSAQFFSGIHATKQSAAGKTDGLRARQTHLIATELDNALPLNLRTKRDELEHELFALRNQKASLDEGAYYQQVENILLKLAEIYDPDP